jgi:glycogen debranching enzyme
MDLVVTVVDVGVCFVTQTRSESNTNQHKWMDQWIDDWINQRRKLFVLVVAVVVVVVVVVCFETQTKTM